MTKYENVGVEILVSDPWDFGTTHGTGPFRGKLLLVEPDPNFKNRNAALIKLDSPLTYKDTKCEFFVAQPRLENDLVEKIVDGVTVNCGLTRISSEQAKSPTPLDLSWWRGGGVTLSVSLRKL